MTTRPTGTQYEISADGQCAVVTQVGATLRRYTVDGRDVVTTFDETQAPHGCQGQHLMPWPNRVRDGRWRHLGREQQLDITEPGRHNAIHGLVTERAFTVVAQHDDRITQRLVLQPQPGWPGTLELLVTHVVGESGLGVEVSAQNLGDEPVPFGYGAHPYLLPPDELGLDECRLVLPFGEYLSADERLLPVARHDVSATPFDRRLAAPLAGQRFDTAFTTPEPADTIWSVTLTGAHRRSVLWGERALGWLQVYTPADRASVAVEPMSCGPDAFNEGPTHHDLRWLAAGEQLRLAWGLRQEDVG